MININFVNLILIIVDHTSTSKKPGNPYLFAFDTSSSFRLSVLIIFDSTHLFASVKSSNPSNSMANFLANVLLNLFCKFGTDVFFNFAINPIPFLTLFSLSDIFALSLSLQDDFFILVAVVLFTLGRDIPLNYSFSASCPLFLLSSLGNSTTFKHLFSTECLFFLLLLPFGNFITLSVFV